MKNSMKNAALFCTGIVLGATLFGGVAAYAAGVMAERSAQAVYVDGQRVELEAYNIGGNNYVKLRDIGAAVDFNVYWDGSDTIATTDNCITLFTCVRDQSEYRWCVRAKEIM